MENKQDIDKKLKQYLSVGNFAEGKYLIKKFQINNDILPKETVKYFNRTRYILTVELPLFRRLGDLVTVHNLISEIKTMAGSNLSQVSEWNEYIADAWENYQKIFKAFSKNEDLTQYREKILWLEQNKWNVDKFTARERKNREKDEKNNLFAQEKSKIESLRSTLAQQSSSLGINYVLQAANKHLENCPKLIFADCYPDWMDLILKAEVKKGELYDCKYSSIIKKCLFEIADELLKNRKQELDEVFKQIVDWSSNENKNRCKTEITELKRELLSITKFRNELNFKNFDQKCKEFRENFETEFVDLIQLQKDAEKLCQEKILTFGPLTKAVDLKKEIEVLLLKRKKEQKEHTRYFSWWFDILFNPWSAIAYAESKIDSNGKLAFVNMHSFEGMQERFYLFTKSEYSEMCEFWNTRKGSARKAIKIAETIIVLFFVVLFILLFFYFKGM